LQHNTIRSLLKNQNHQFPTESDCSAHPEGMECQ